MNFSFSRLLYLQNENKHDRRESQTPLLFLFDLVKKLVGNLAKPPVNHGKTHPPSVSLNSLHEDDGGDEYDDVIERPFRS